MTNAEKFAEVFGYTIDFVFFKLSFNGYLKWLNATYEKPEVDDDN